MYEVKGKVKVTIFCPRAVLEVEYSRIHTVLEDSIPVYDWLLAVQLVVQQIHNEPK